MKQILIAAAPLMMFLLLAATSANAAVKSQPVDYKEGDTALQGFVYFDDAAAGADQKRPAVLVVHEWYGLNDYAKSRAEQLAKLGYVAFAVDIYGKGVMAQNREEAAKMAGRYKEDRPLLRRRVQAGLDALKQQPNVDPTKIAAIGYCFGGTTALELARSGAEVAGVVSFHGGLGTPMPAAPSGIKAKVLALHGLDDPFVPDAEVVAFRDEMKAAKVDYAIVGYGNSVHGFTNPANGSDNSKGAAYNEAADKRSWQAMKDFFNEIFGVAAAKE